MAKSKPAPTASVAPHIFKRRGVIVSISAIVIIAVGAFTGAMMKTDVQKTAMVRQVQTENLEERLDRLKGYRAILERQKSGLEGKISVLQEKRAEENT